MGSVSRWVELRRRPHSVLQVVGEDRTATGEEGGEGLGDSATETGDNSEGVRKEGDEGGSVGTTPHPYSYAGSSLLSLAAAAARAEG